MTELTTCLHELIPPGCEVLLEGHSWLLFHENGDLRRNRFLQDAAFVFCPIIP